MHSQVAASVVLLPRECTINCYASICVAEGLKSYTASQYSSNPDTFAADVASYASCGPKPPVLIVHSGLSPSECSRILCSIISRLLDFDKHVTWSGLALWWHLEQQHPSTSCSTPINETRDSPRLAVNVTCKVDLQQWLEAALLQYQASTADGCWITLQPSSGCADTVSVPLHILVVQEQVTNSIDTLPTSSSSSGNSANTISSSKPSGSSIVSKLLTAAGVKCDDVAACTSLMTHCSSHKEEQQQLPHDIQHLLAKQGVSSSSSSSSGGGGGTSSHQHSSVLLLSLLPSGADQAAQAASDRMLQLTTACVNIPPASEHPTAAAAAAADANMSSSGARFSEIAPSSCRSSWCSSSSGAAARNLLVDRLNKQVSALEAQLSSAHSHYQQLLDKLVPGWQHDHTALETTAAPRTKQEYSSSSSSNVAVEDSNSSSNKPDNVQAADTHASTNMSNAGKSNNSGSTSSGVSGCSPAAPAAAAPAAPSVTGAARVSMLSRSSMSADGGRSVAALDAQIDQLRRDLRSSRDREADLEADLAAVTDRAAAREGQLTTDLKKAISSAAQAARRAAEEKAGLTAQLHELQSELKDLKSRHSDELTSAQQQVVAVVQQINKQVAALRADPAAATPRRLTQQIQQEARQQVSSQQQLLTLQLTSVRDQSSQLSQQQQQKITELTSKLEAAESQQQQTQQKLKQLQSDAATVWKYALALNEILCKCESGHYPVQDISGLRYYHITRQDKPPALAAADIPELAHQLGLAQQYLALIKVADPAAVTAGKLRYSTNSNSRSNNTSRPGSARQMMRPYTHAAASTSSASSGCHSSSSGSGHGCWMVSGTACITRQQYSNDLAVFRADDEGSNADCGGCKGRGSAACEHVAAGICSSNSSRSSRPVSAASAVRAPAHTATAGVSPSSGSAEAKLKQQLETQLHAEMQQRAAAVLSTLSCGDVSSTEASSTPQHTPDMIAVAHHAAHLQQQLERAREELLQEKRRASELLIAVRSVQRCQASSACSYLSGVTRPDSPGAAQHTAQHGTAGRPGKQQQQPECSGCQPGWGVTRPSSALARPASAVAGSRRPQSACR